MKGAPCVRCGTPILEWCWRDPTRCLGCYLDLKRGSVIVCTTGDVRMLDNVPGGFATRRDSKRVITRRSSE